MEVQGFLPSGILGLTTSLRESLDLAAQDSAAGMPQYAGQI
jgi:hypothetical protein